jgi:peptide/nickel transport system ATP-binding protein
MSLVRYKQEETPVRTARQPILAVDGLIVGFPGLEGPTLAVRGVSFSVGPGETLGIVGESGCGKSLTLRALIGLVPEPGSVLAGAVTWQGAQQLLGEEEQLREVRGREISMIFQDPLQSLNPVFSIGDQLTEVLRLRAGLSRRDARQRAVHLLDRVGIASASARLGDFPHQLSGGMRQRVMIAIALACDPVLLLADEPTTALDVTVQDQILSLLAELQAENGMSTVLVSHDLGVIAQMADQVAVMYAGHFVETGSCDEILLSPRHPYTAALISSAPRASTASGSARFAAIGGSPPTIEQVPVGCPFAPRCDFATAGCGEVDMSLDAELGAHRSACPMTDLSEDEEGSGDGG